jgi:hypothetical protein
MEKTRTRYAMTTLAIVLLVGTAFFLTNFPDAEKVIARAVPMPRYRSDKSAVCLITVVDCSLEDFLPLAQKANAAKIPLTLAVSAAKLKPAVSSETASQILSLGHSIALYGLISQGDQASWMEQSTAALAVFRASTGDRSVLYVPYLGQHTSRTARFCEQNGLMPLLYSKDSRAFLAKSKHAFANVLAQNAQAGDFIYIGVDGETDFLAIAAAFSQRQTQLRTVTSVLD